DATTPASSLGMSGLIATPVPRGADPAGAAPVDAGTPGLGVEPPPQPFAQVAEVRVEVRSPTPITLPASPLNAPREAARELPWLWLAGLILLAVGPGRAYWQRGTTPPRALSCSWPRLGAVVCAE